MYNSNMNVLKKQKDEKIIKKILKNHFEEFKLKYWNKVRREMRDQIENTVIKALNCGNIEKGYIKHKCIDCGEEYIQGFTCKSKFCTKCGRKYSMEWAEKQVENILDVPHRHAVFTIPEELRVYFYRKRELLKDLQDATYKVLDSFHKMKTKGNYELGVISVVHTFGGDLKWNPHIHALYTEGGIDRNNKWFKKLDFIPYTYMKKVWRKLVLDIIKNNFRDRKTRNLINKLYKKEFYVNAERRLTNIKQATQYIGRYLARPAIAEYRIINYDGKNVTYWYENKKPKGKREITVNVLEFIGKITQHIHPKGFRVARRYGLYSRIKNKLSIEILKLYNFMKHRNISKLIKKKNTVKKNFKDRLIESFGVNPYICKKCGKDMILWEIWHYKYGLIYNALDKSNYKRIIYEEIIEKEISLNTTTQIELF